MMNFTQIGQQCCTAQAEAHLRPEVKHALTHRFSRKLIITQRHYVQVFYAEFLTF